MERESVCSVKRDANVALELVPSVRILRSPIGLLTLIGTDEGIEELWWDIEKKSSDKIKNSTLSVLVDAEKQLVEYFKGLRKSFDLPLKPSGTPFQKSVWSHLYKIPFGQTLSYGDLARRLGDPKKARAVGSAVGRNPLPIFLPCHRVVGNHGKIGGFSGGIGIKKFLLSFEFEQT